MTAISRRINFLLLALLTVVAFGCGGGGGSTAGTTTAGASAPVDTTSVQKGAVVQGPVSGATVFADNVAAGTRFVFDDPGEIKATTDSTGKFSLPSFPSYDFVLVSIGGKDTITGLDALLLVAPAGSANITPLTTLVTLDTSKRVQAKLEALMGGTKFDTNVSVNASPAILLLIKSAEYAVQSVSDAVKQAAARDGKTLTQAQLNYIQAQTWQQIALTFAETTQNLATPAGLDTALTAAISSALVEIPAKNPNISFSTLTSAATIAHDAVNAALAALRMTGVTYASTGALSTTTVQPESSLLSTVFSTALNLTVSKTLASVVIIGVTPSPYSPAPIPVVTTSSAAIIRIITGTSGGSGGIGVTW